MDDSIQISSDSEEEVPFYERVSRKVYGSNTNTSANRFTSMLSKSGQDVSRSLSPSSPPSSNKESRSCINVQITPPPPSPEVTSYRPLIRSKSPPPLLSSNSSGSSLLVPSSSSANGSSKSKKQKLSKEEKEIERQKKQEEKENNKAIKAAEKIVAKQTDKTEVNKYMEVIIDPDTVSCPPGSDILSALQKPPTEKAEHVFKYRVQSLAVPGSLTWRRKIVSFSVNNGRVQFEESWQEEARVLIFISTLEVAEKIENKTIETWARNAKKTFGGKHISLMIYGFKEHFKEEKNAAERVRKAQLRGDRPAKKDLERMAAKVTKYYFDEAMMNLQLEGLADNHTFDKTAGKDWKDLGHAVFHHTRGVAEAPLKLRKGLSDAGGFSFWAKADGKDCVDVKNLTEYWKQILMTVSSKAGLETVTAIVSRYPSPTALLKAYSSCGSVKECQELLKDTEVRRTDNIMGGTRRVGPDISRKIYTMMTCHNPDTLLTQIQ